MRSVPAEGGETGEGVRKNVGARPARGAAACGRTPVWSGSRDSGGGSGRAARG